MELCELRNEEFGRPFRTRQKAWPHGSSFWTEIGKDSSHMQCRVPYGSLASKGTYSHTTHHATHGLWYRLLDVSSSPFTILKTRRKERTRTVEACVGRTTEDHVYVADLQGSQRKTYLQFAPEFSIEQGEGRSGSRWNNRGAPWVRMLACL